MNKRLLCATVAFAAALLANGASAQALRMNGAAAPSGTQGLALQPDTSLPPLSGPAPHHTDGIAAVVGEQVITDYELSLRMRDAEAQIAQRGQTAPPAGQLRAAVLNQMVDQLALAEYAQETGINVDDATLTRAVSDVANSYHLTPDQLRAKVQAQGMDWKDYRESIRREIEIARLRQRDAASKVTVSDREVDDYLATAATGAKSRVLDLAQIVVDVPSGADDQVVAAARQKIDRAAAELQQGRDFAAVAAAESSGPTAAQGGELGARPASEWPQLFADAVRGLQPGQVSGVVRSPAGFHILKLVSAHGGAGLPSTAMQAEVRQIVIKAADPRAREAAERELSAVRDAVAAGKVGFDAKAREISQDLDTARRGGDLGWLLPGSLPPALGAALDRLNPGQVSDPVVLADRVVLLQLVDRREQALTKDQQRAVARDALRRQKEAAAFDDLVQDVRARTYVRIPDSDS